jgi:hypothetical protein
MENCERIPIEITGILNDVDFGGADESPPESSGGETPPLGSIPALVADRALAFAMDVTRAINDVEFHTALETKAKRDPEVMDYLSTVGKVDELYMIWYNKFESLAKGENLFGGPPEQAREKTEIEASQASRSVFSMFLEQLKGFPNERKCEIPEWIISKILSAKPKLSYALEDQILTVAGGKEFGFGGKRALTKTLKEERERIRLAKMEEEMAGDGDASVRDFYAFLPQHKYLHVPTRALWPEESIDARFGDDFHLWFDQNRFVEQFTWNPGEGEIIKDKVFAGGGFIDKEDAISFNLYLPPQVKPGDPRKAQRWLDLMFFLYPNSTEHILNWLAHRVQFPGVKINHALLMGGKFGIGKDTLFEPAKYAVGPWNFEEVSPGQIMMPFNGFLKSVIMRISEVKDQGDVNRYEFHNFMKSLTASPPDVLRVNEKHLKEYPIANVTSIIYTTNYRTDSLYIPPGDRRHYVDWSDRDASEFPEGFWPSMYHWLAEEGNRHGAAYLMQRDISKFDAKAPPLKTQAYFNMVDAGRPQEDSELADLIDSAGNPKAFTINDLTSVSGSNDISAPFSMKGPHQAIRTWLDDRKNIRQIPHRLEVCGYTAIRNDCDKTQGRWKIRGKRQTVYALSDLTHHERLAAVEELGMKPFTVWKPDNKGIFR